MGANKLLRSDSWPLRAILVMVALGATQCGTGGTLIDGTFQGAKPGASGTASTSSAAQTAAPTATTAGGGSSAKGAATVGVEVDTQGGAIDVDFWSGAVAAVGSLSKSPRPAARIVVGSYRSSSGVNLAYADDEGASALPKGRSGVTFTGDRGAEALLTALDGLGASVVLEIQPGFAPLPTLTAEVLQHYKNHKSVVGVGINLVYYGTDADNLGFVSLSDADAQAIVQAVQKTGSSATVYLRHYSSDYMPPKARSGLGFVFDAEGFNDLDDMSSDYRTWASKFAPAPVQFVTGASKDRAWSCALSGGAATLMAQALKVGDNVDNVTWSSSTITRLYPANTFGCLN